MEEKLLRGIIEKLGQLIETVKPVGPEEMEDVREFSIPKLDSHTFIFEKIPQFITVHGIPIAGATTLATTIRIQPDSAYCPARAPFGTAEGRRTLEVELGRTATIRGAIMVTVLNTNTDNTVNVEVIGHSRPEVGIK
jgi:hypothetical protein